MPPRTVCGLLAPRCIGSARKYWNALFRKQGIDAFFDWYKASTIQDLELRLAEMFHLDRRGYIIAPALQEMILPLLDQIDPSAAEKGSVDTVVNENGVLVGFRMGDWNEEEVADRMLKLWFQ